jgi:hypothetical protein
VTRGVDPIGPAIRRYRAALDLIRAGDILRVLKRANRATGEDAESVTRARHQFDGVTPPRERRGRNYQGAHRASEVEQ